MDATLSCIPGSSFPSVDPGLALWVLPGRGEGFERTCPRFLLTQKRYVWCYFWVPLPLSPARIECSVIFTELDLLEGRWQSRGLLDPGYLLKRGPITKNDHIGDFLSLWGGKKPQTHKITPKNIFRPPTYTHTYNHKRTRRGGAYAQNHWLRYPLHITTQREQ